MPDSLHAREPDPDALPPSVVSGDGCWNCRHWDRSGTALGHCWAPNELLLKLRSEARNGWRTCSSYICPAFERGA